MNYAIKNFMKEHFKHFNAAAVVDAAEAYCELLDSGGKMFLAMAGAMSTAEIGKSLAEMIRKEKVHAISCTGANLEEDLYNLIGHSRYKAVPKYRELTAEDEKKIYEAGFNRVTDTCIPNETMDRITKEVSKIWIENDEKNEAIFPHECLYKLIKSGELEKYYDIEPKHSWVIAAAEKNLPLFVPGWEDSTLGNAFVAHQIKGKIKNFNTMKSGLYYMKDLVGWYKRESAKTKIGFFQIGGGIAGDFPICVIPLIIADLKESVPFWSYFCQISDSTTSYGSYSGAVPNEKITWGKLDKETPRFIIESDATIVAPLIFAYVLGW